MGLGYLTRPTRRKNARVPVIRKIIRHSSFFWCGICRNKHDNEDEALECLDSCWTKILHGEHVLPVYDRSKVRYKCIFCSRVHKDEPLALECAEECLDLRKNKHYADMKAFQIPVSEYYVERPPIVPRVKQQVKLDLIPKYHFAKKTEKTEAEASPAVEESQPDWIGKGVIDDRKARTKADFPKIFIRNAAKYQCTYCHTDFFTKMEVEACFAKHFNEEGVELEPNLEPKPNLEPQPSTEPKAETEAEPEAPPAA